jgi:hypothetical protein
MNRIHNLVCTHPRLRTLDYDETYHWVVECVDCGHLASMTQAQWRAWQRAHVKAALPSALSVGDEGPESGRLERPFP